MRGGSMPEPALGVVEAEGGTAPAVSRRVAANRRNALKSMGPRTPAGKERSRRNALRHAILARETLISAGEGREDRATFERLRERFWADLAPQNIVEEVLVERAFTAYWRLARVLRAESGAIRQRLDTLSFDQEQRERERAEELQDDDIETVATRSGDLAGLETLLEAVREAREEVEEQGYLDVDAAERFAQVFGAVDPILEPPCKGSSRAAQEGRKADALAWLSEIEADFESRRGALVAKSELEHEHDKMRLAVPGERELMRLARYEAHLERQFYKALHELERLQRMRAGEAVPPRLHLEVTSE